MSSWYHVTNHYSISLELGSLPSLLLPGFLSHQPVLHIHRFFQALENRAVSLSQTSFLSPWSKTHTCCESVSRFTFECVCVCVSTHVCYGALRTSVCISWICGMCVASGRHARPYGCFPAHACGPGRLRISVHMCLCLCVCAPLLCGWCICVSVCLISAPKGFDGLRQELVCRDNLLRC